MGKLKNLFNGIKSWLSSNGIVGILGLVLGLILWSFGYKIFAGFSFGVFAIRNWDMLVNLISKKINKK